MSARYCAISLGRSVARLTRAFSSTRWQSTVTWSGHS